jgi:hypothetical protein
MHFNAADMQNVTLVLIMCTTSRLKDRWSVRRRGFGVYQLCFEMQVHRVQDFVSSSNDISPSMIYSLDLGLEFQTDMLGHSFSEMHGSTLQTSKL